MFNGDAQTLLASWRRGEHPIDQMLTPYLNRTGQMRPNLHHKQQLQRNRSNNNHSNHLKSETKQVIQRQRAIRSFLSKPDEFQLSAQKSTATVDTLKVPLLSAAIPSPHVLFADLHEQSNKSNRQQAIKKDADWQLSAAQRRRSITENSSHPSSDIVDIVGSQLPLVPPPQFIFRSKPLTAFGSTPRNKLLSQSKRSIDGDIKRQIKWLSTPTAVEQEAIHNRAVASLTRSKSYLLKNNGGQRQQLFEKEISDSKTHHIRGLHVSAQPVHSMTNESPVKRRTNKKQSIGEWENHEDNSDGLSDEVEFAEETTDTTGGNSFSSRYDSQTNLNQFDYSSSRSEPNHFRSTSIGSHSSSSSSLSDDSNSNVIHPITKTSISRRRPFRLALPTVNENVDDEETGDDNTVLRKLYEAREKFSHMLQEDFDNENSLTFELLNQPETKFERNLSLSNRKPSVPTIERRRRRHWR